MGAAGASASAEDRSDEIRLVTRSYLSTYIVKVATTVFVTLTMNRDGDLVITRDGLGTPAGTPNSDEWHRDNTGSTLGDDWDVRATVTAGSLDSGSTAWQRLNANRAWNVTVTDFSLQNATLTFDFRLNGTSTILATVTGVLIQANQAAL